MAENSAERTMTFTTAEIEMRKANPSEANRLTAIAFAAKRYWNYPEAYIELWKDGLTFTPENVKNSIVFAATLNEGIIGFYAIKATEVDATVELDDLWIEPKYIGQGVGKMLFQHALEVSQLEGARNLRLVAEPNALGFYQKMGMTKVGEVASKPEGRVLDIMAIDISPNCEPENSPEPKDS